MCILKFGILLTYYLPPYQNNTQGYVRKEKHCNCHNLSLKKNRIILHQNKIQNTELSYLDKRALRKCRIIF